MSHLISSSLSSMKLLLLSVCGNQNKLVMTSTSSMMVRFTSDSSKRAAGAKGCQVTCTKPATAPLTTNTTAAQRSEDVGGGCGDCVFPFIVNGRESDRCTTIDGGGTSPWCLDSSGSRVNCSDSSCPGLKGNSPPISVHPKNKVGSCCT